jgi:predicted DNA-binding WGR domain protein
MTEVEPFENPVEVKKEEKHLRRGKNGRGYETDPDGDF